MDGVFEELLHAEDPVSALSGICQKIPQRYSLAEISRLRTEGKFDCLGFACLPTLNSCLASFRDFPELGKDLFEEGLVVLFQKIREWDPSKKPEEVPVPLRQFVGNEVSLKLTEFVLRKYGLGGVDDLPLVRLYRKCWGEFVTECGRQPELQEINGLVEEENVGAFSLFFREDIKRPEKNKKKISKVKLMYYSTQRILVEDPVSELDSENERGSFRRCLGDDMYRIMSSLSPLEKTILRLRYFPGEREIVFGNNPAWTLDRVAEYFGVDREKVRQIESKALRKLRNPAQSRKVRDYLS